MPGRKHRHERRQDRRHKCQNHHEKHHHAVDANRVHPRQPTGRQRDQRPQREPGCTEPNRTCDERQDETLTHDLTGETTTGRSEGDPDSELGTPDLSPYEQQVGHVRTCDQQDEPDRPEQKGHRKAHFSNHHVGDRSHRGHDARVHYAGRSDCLELRRHSRERA